jgi:hypothetical protein
MGQFTETKADEFLGRTDTTHKGHVDIRPRGLGHLYPKIELKLRQSETKDAKHILLDLLYQADDWLFPGAGFLALVLDGETNKLDFFEFNTETRTDLYPNRVICCEYGHYEISPELLRKLCEAKIVQGRIYGKGGFVEDKWDDELIQKNAEYRTRFEATQGRKYVPGEMWGKQLQTHFRTFYNETVDSAAYAEVVKAEVEKAAKSGCFIATAAMGSSEEMHVLELRCFRDRVLLRSRLGEKFVNSYYDWSPPVARQIQKSSFARFAVRWLLIRPVTAWFRSSRYY